MLNKSKRHKGLTLIEALKYLNTDRNAKDRYVWATCGDCYDVKTFIEKKNFSMEEVSSTWSIGIRPQRTVVKKYNGIAKSDYHEFPKEFEFLQTGNWIITCEEIVMSSTQSSKTIRKV